MTEQELQRTIRDLVDCRQEVDEDSTEYRNLTNALRRLRNTYEAAGGIIEDLDPYG